MKLFYPELPDYWPAPRWYVYNLAGQRRTIYPLVLDLANKYCGSELPEDAVVDVDTILRNYTRQELSAMLSGTPIPDERPSRMRQYISDADYVDEGLLTTTEKRGIEMAAFLSQAALEHADLRTVPGRTPAEKAIAYVASLVRGFNQAWNSKNGNDQSRMGEQDAEEMVRKANNGWAKWSKMTEEERAALVKALGGKYAGQEDVRTSVDIISQEISVGVLRVFDRVGRVLNQRGVMSVMHQIKWTDDPDGDDYNFRGIEKISEMGKMTTTEKAMALVAPEYMTVKLAQHKTMVRMRGWKQTRKQMILMLLDVSGSMFPTYAPVLFALASNRIKYALAHKAEIYIMPFASSVGKLVHIAGDLVEVAVEENKSPFTVLSEILGRELGGGTRLHTALIRAYETAKQLAEDHDLIKPEVVLISDDDGDFSDRLYMDFWKDTEVRLSNILTARPGIEWSQSLDAVAQKCKTSGGTFLPVSNEGELLATGGKSWFVPGIRHKFHLPLHRAPTLLDYSVTKGG